MSCSPMRVWYPAMVFISARLQMAGGHKGSSLNQGPWACFLKRLGYASKPVTRDGETKRIIIAEEH